MSFPGLLQALNDRQQQLLLHYMKELGVFGHVKAGQSAFTGGLAGRGPTHQGCTERTFRKKRVALWDVLGYNWKASKRPPTIRASVSWGSAS